jgi:hypothetical protein
MSNGERPSHRPVLEVPGCPHDWPPVRWRIQRPDLVRRDSNLLLDIHPEGDGMDRCLMLEWVGIKWRTLPWRTRPAKVAQFHAV